MKKSNIVRVLYRSLVKNFIKGLLLLAPLYITIFLITRVVKFLDNHMAAGVPGLGIVVLFCLSTLFGYLASYIFPAYRKIGILLETIPVVNVIYASFRDIAYSFSSRRSKYRQPVLVTDNDGNTYKIGFVTKNTLVDMGWPDLVSVYILKSHSLLGEVVVVDKSKIIKLDVDSSDIVKFVVSGGFSGLGKDRSEKEIEVIEDEQKKIK